MFNIAAFYQFASFPDFEDWQDPLKELMAANEVRGTILLAPEGLNGTIAGTKAGVDAVLSHIRSDERFRDTLTKWSEAEFPPFPRLKVRLKKEIVRMKVGEIDVANETGHKVDPKDWNDLIREPDVVVIDTRNDYEYAIGTFEGAIDPQTDSFGEFADWIEGHPDINKDTKIAMFCTGGIRCEKASAYLKGQGFEDVNQLHGGILRYLEEVPEEDSAWDGQCFVFDWRISVGHGLTPGGMDFCENCNRALTPGITCRSCGEVPRRSASPEDLGQLV
jgi:UPF0176 protein